MTKPTGQVWDTITSSLPSRSTLGLTDREIKELCQGKKDNRIRVTHGRRTVAFSAFQKKSSGREPSRPRQKILESTHTSSGTVRTTENDKTFDHAAWRGVGVGSSMGPYLTYSHLDKVSFSFACISELVIELNRFWVKATAVNLTETLAVCFTIAGAIWWIDVRKNIYKEKKKKPRKISIVTQFIAFLFTIFLIIYGFFEA